MASNTQAGEYQQQVAGAAGEQQGGAQAQAEAAPRASLAVSFSEVELSERAAEQPQRGCAVDCSLRYFVMLVALVSPFVVTYSRTIINFAIIDMIHPDYLDSGAASTTTERPGSSAAELGPLQPPPHQQRHYFELDNSCPVGEQERARLLSDMEQGRERARVSNSNDLYEWDTVKQGQLKAAYASGHMLLQVLGGRLAELYGSHLIMSACSALIALACFAAPLLASLHFYLLFLDLMLLGVVGSFMTPALITLFSNWLTPSEKSLTLSLYMVSSRLGYAFSALLCGLLIEARLSWRYLFYSAAWIALAFGLLFGLLARSRPDQHPLMGKRELSYLAAKNKLVREALRARDHSKSPQLEAPIELKTASEQVAASERQAHAAKRPAAPWLAIITNGAVWAFVVTKFCVKIAGDTVQIELPAYLSRVMHMTAADNGKINASNYFIFCISCLLVGALAKCTNKRRPFGLDKTTMRKLFQCSASFGVTCLLVLLSLCICQRTATILILMLFFFVTTLSTGGEAQIPLDISERYSGTIHAIGSSLAISGAIEPILVGFLLKDHAADVDRWRYVWLGAASFAFIGGLTFLIFGDATVQPFDEIVVKDSTNEQAADVQPTGAKKAARADTPAGHVNHSFEPEQVADRDDSAHLSESRESVQI